MRLDARTGLRGRIVDLDTGLDVPRVCWLDVEAGLLNALDSGGVPYLAKGRFRFIPRTTDKGLSVVLGAPKCDLCRSNLTLPGDTLCPPCRAKERGQRHRMTVERIVNPLLDRKCERCHRLAEYAVGDEVVVTPVVGAYPAGIPRRGKVAYGRGMTVERHWFCSWHYQAPRILDARGEVVSSEDDIKVRPA